MEGVNELKKSIIWLVLLLTMISSQVASQTIISCEAFAMWGIHKSQDYKTHPKIFPTILIKEDSRTITYVYTQHNQKWEKEFQIAFQNDKRFVGISELSATTLQIIHYEKNTGKFNIFFSGGYLELENTMTTGRCFK